MNWSNVKLILSREIRDQLRDRRTLFMIAVLPMLLYPLLGMSFLQFSQFLEEKPSRVLVIGALDIAGRHGLPPLFDAEQGSRFDSALFFSDNQMRLLELEFAPDEPLQGVEPPDDPRRHARQLVQSGQFDAALFFPSDFIDRLDAFRQDIKGRMTRPIEDEESDARLAATATQKIPSPEIIFSTATEESQICYGRLSGVLQRWSGEIGKSNLTAGGMPAETVDPFDLELNDIDAETGYSGAAIWSKVLPVILIIWAMTGAFYPAVDLCAGEKERGTLETLLSSPAERSEIVVGKLLTITAFSMATAALNMLSMGVTGWLVLSRMQEFQPPTLVAFVWLTLALVPISAMFSAVCLALAALARSTKEGQYYLMPLLTLVMPLVILPMSPGVQLNLGNSLIPVSGMVLLLRALLEGNYWQAAQFCPAVLVVTLGCCLLSIRWAIDQFNSESVLFRESERLDARLWLRHLIVDRGPTPTVAGAMVCGAVILLLRFIVNLTMAPPDGFYGFAVTTVLMLVAVVLLPAMLLTAILTRSPKQTLLLRRPPWLAIPAAAALAVALYPSVAALNVAVAKLYPLSEEMMNGIRAVEGMFHTVPLWQLLLVIAVAPAICEELAFRGFILSGFRQSGHKWRPIIYTSLFFALSHAILQQSIVACTMGIVIGYLAVQTNSIWPCMVFHMIHNSLGMATSRLTPELLGRTPVLKYLIDLSDEATMLCPWPVVIASAMVAVALLAWFHYLPNGKSKGINWQETGHGVFGASG
jgi:sodium transport system permease protein